MVKITNVDENSLAHQAGILPSDYLISINGNDINDILDYNFYLAEKKLDCVCRFDVAEVYAENGFDKARIVYLRDAFQ